MHHGIVEGCQQHQLGCGIEMAQAAADRSAASRLVMTDVREGVGEQWRPSLHLRVLLKCPLPHERADSQTFALERDRIQARKPVKVNNVIWKDVAHVEHRH